jgi:hypothetical protein
MGIGLVKAAKQSHWARALTSNERMILICMASRCLDEDREGQDGGIYWGGIDTLILELTGSLPDLGTPAHETQKRRVKRHLKALREKGAIEIETHGVGRGRRSAYRLTLFSYLNGWPVDNSEGIVRMFGVKGGPEGPLLGDVKGDVRAPFSTRKRGP